MNRREKRKIKKEINIFLDVISIIKQYFPQLTQKLNELTDVRHQSYVQYQMSVITVTRNTRSSVNKKYERNDGKI